MLICFAEPEEPVRRRLPRSLRRRSTVSIRWTGVRAGNVATCRAIAAGNSMNVIEIDAASNNGVDNIREIREEVAVSVRPKENTKSTSSMRCICFPSERSMHCLRPWRSRRRMSFLFWRPRRRTRFRSRFYHGASAMISAESRSTRSLPACGN